MAKEIKNIKDIEAAMVQQLKKSVYVDVEVTFAGGGNWTISGQTSNVEAAVGYLEHHRLMKMDSKHYDAELNETFAYMVTI